MHSSPAPNPYEQEHQSFQPIHMDPFMNPQQPLQNPYSSPMPAPPTPHPPSPPPQGYQTSLHPGSPPLMHPGSPSLMHPVSPPPMHQVSPSPQIYPSPTPSPYEPHGQGFDPQEEDMQDTGDMPLLRRPSGGVHSPPMPMPGEYDPPTSDDRSESNIRYGRIPQRVPRRFKTIKKVE